MPSIKLPNIRHKVYIYIYIDISTYSRWFRTYKVVVTICILNLAHNSLKYSILTGYLQHYWYSVFCNSFTIFSVHVENLQSSVLTHSGRAWSCMRCIVELVDHVCCSVYTGSHGVVKLILPELWPAGINSRSICLHV